MIWERKRHLELLNIGGTKFALRFWLSGVHANHEKPPLFFTLVTHEGGAREFLEASNHEVCLEHNKH